MDPERIVCVSIMPCIAKKYECAVEQVNDAAKRDVDMVLTTRELELLAELPSLRTAEEIAASMYLSVNTVKTHIRHLLQKLGLRDRVQAVVLAHEHGLV